MKEGGPQDRTISVRVYYDGCFHSHVRNPQRALSERMLVSLPFFSKAHRFGLNAPF